MRDLYVPKRAISFYNLFAKNSTSEGPLKKKIRRKIKISRKLLSEFFVPRKLRADYYVLDKIAYEFTRMAHSNCWTHRLQGKNVRGPPPLPETEILPPGYILASVRHLLRYKFLELLSHGKKVLDCACGCGYGTYILGRSAKEVVGIDLDSKVIEFANKYHKIERTIFYNIPIEEFSKKENDFDVVVSVETLEHIPPDKVDSFISGLKSSVKQDGLIVLTTPRCDKTMTYTRDADEYHSHFREYNKDDFLGVLIRNKLKIEQYLLQSFDGSIIYQIPKKTKFPHATTLDSYVQIAVCSI